MLGMCMSRSAQVDLLVVRDVKASSPQDAGSVQNSWGSMISHSVSRQSRSSSVIRIE